MIKVRIHFYANFSGSTEIELVGKEEEEFRANPGRFFNWFEEEAAELLHQQGCIVDVEIDEFQTWNEERPGWDDVPAG